MRRSLRGKDRIAASGLVADDDPFASSITGSGSHERLSTGCDGKTYLAPWQFIRMKESDTADAVPYAIEAKRRPPIGIPVRSVLHDHMVAPLHYRCWLNTDDRGRNTGLTENDRRSLLNGR
jgi:hypothetical protein